MVKLLPLMLEHKLRVFLLLRFNLGLEIKAVLLSSGTLLSQLFNHHNILFNFAQVPLLNLIHLGLRLLDLFLQNFVGGLE